MRSIVFLFFLLGQLSALAQDQKYYYDSLLLANYPADGPGAVALIARGDSVLYQQAVGMANLELKVPMQTDMVFQIASLTKQITAIAILMLREEGKLKLTDDITRFLPNYPMQGHKITIHHLLTHTSGIKSYTSLPALPSLFRKDLTPEQIMESFQDEPMDFAPGEEYRYNDSGYILLGMIIEKLSGMSYPQFLESRIFAPLQMENTLYGSHTKIVTQRAHGYQYQDGWVNAAYLSFNLPYAAGSVMSTAKDLWRWNQVLVNNELISEESLKLAHTNYTLNNGKPINYGYGLEINSLFGKTSIEHSGGIIGYTCNAIYLPEEELYIVVLTNTDKYHPIELSRQLAEVAINGAQQP